MEDIRNSLLNGSGEKLSKKQYKFAVELEKSRLLQQLGFLTFVSFLIAVILFISLYFDIKDTTHTSTSEVATEGTADVKTDDVVDTTPASTPDSTVDTVDDSQDATGTDTTGTDKTTEIDTQNATVWRSNTNHHIS